MLSVSHCFVHLVFALHILPLFSHFRAAVGKCLSGASQLFTSFASNPLFFPILFPHLLFLAHFLIFFSSQFWFFLFCLSHSSFAFYLLGGFHILNQCLGPRWTCVLGTPTCFLDKMSIFQGQDIPDLGFQLSACLYLLLHY